MNECCDLLRGRTDRAVCPECGRYSKPVEHRTPEHLLTDAARPRLGPGPFLFCISPDCPVVYFDPPGGSVFHTEDVRVRVTRKESGDPVPICYCYGHTRADLLKEIRETGRTTIPDRIRAGVKAGTCRCEETNPQGSCCLGNVSRAHAWARHQAAHAPAAAGEEP